MMDIGEEYETTMVLQWCPEPTKKSKIENSILIHSIKPEI